LSIAIDDDVLSSKIDWIDCLYALRFFNAHEFSDILFIKILDKCLERKENLNFIVLSKLYYSISIFDANNRFPSSFYKENLDKIIRALNQQALIVLHTIQPYFSVHQFILAVDYLSLCYPEVVMALLQDQHYKYKRDYIENRSSQPTISKLQKEVTTQLAEHFGNDSVLAERMIGLLSSDIILNLEPKRFAVQINGPTHYRCNSFDDSSSLEFTSKHIFHSVYIEKRGQILIIDLSYSLCNEGKSAIIYHIKQQIAPQHAVPSLSSPAAFFASPCSDGSLDCPALGQHASPVCITMTKE
jgi:hypothetical protein